MDNEGRTLIARRILLVLLVLIVLGVVAWALFFRDEGRQSQGSGTAKSGQRTDAESKPGQTKSAQKDGQTSGSQNKTTERSGQASAGTTNQAPKTAAVPSTSSPQSQPARLADTGPGSLTSLFVGAVVAGSLAHALHCRLSGPKRPNRTHG